MTEPPRQGLDYQAEEREDTDETSLASRIPLLRWYRKTTRGFGISRPYFMPVGFLSLIALAFYLGFPSLLQLSELVLLAIHQAVAAAGRLVAGPTGPALDDVLALSARRAGAPFLALAWAVSATVKLFLDARPLSKGPEDLGYILPGSGAIARAWSVVGKPAYHLRIALSSLVSYFRHLNLEKLYLPLVLPALLLLAGVSLEQASENLFFELPARLPALQSTTGWIPWAAWASTLVVMVFLGAPLLVNVLKRAHQKSVVLQKQRVGLVRRTLSGLLGLVVLFLPLAWMILDLLAGNLW